METRVKILPEESKEVERLFLQFTGYCNILGYLANFGTVDTDKFDRKWAEAVDLEGNLTKLKAQLDTKYHPQDGNDYHTFVFDFDTHEMVYT